MKKQRLLWQLYPTYLFVILIAIITVGWYASSSYKKSYLDQTKMDLISRAEFAKDRFSMLDFNSSEEEINQICKRLGKLTNTRITVIWSNGDIIADSDENILNMNNHEDRPEIRAIINNDIPYKYSIRSSPTLNSKKMMYLAVPVYINGSVGAVVRVSLPIKDMDKNINFFYGQIIIVTIIISIISALICLIISRKIAYPLEQLKNEVARFADGDLSKKIITTNNLEISELSEAVNNMASELDHRIRTITKTRNEQKAVLKSMVEAVIAIDKNQNIIEINQAAIKLCENENQNIKGLKLTEAIRNSQLQTFAIKALNSNNTIEQTLELQKNQEICYIQARGTSLKNEDNIQIGALIVLNDITQIQKLEKIRTDFVANVSHELKTPITSIKGFVETLLENTVNNPEDTKRFLEIISRQTNRLNAIIDDLLCLSRIEQTNDKNRVRIEPSLIIPVINAAIELCKLKADQKNIQIETKCNPETKVMASSPLLEQAITNLLDNAIKYSPDNSKILIQVLIENDSVKISIIDHGSGIASKHLTRLFERFYRVDKARSSSLGGTGLGLAIVKHIAQANNGSVSVKSTIGQGSEFALCLNIPK